MAAALQRRDTRDKRLMPDLRDSGRITLRNWIIKAFDRDLAVASGLGAAFNVTSLFTPMLEARGGRPERAGLDALEVVVPNISALPWEASVEFREHKGSAEARAMLREFERKAASEEPEDATAYLVGLHQEVQDALFSALEQQRTQWPKKIAEEVAKNAVGFIPVVGQVAGPVLSAVEMGTEWNRERHSWAAALMKLRNASP